MCPVPSESERLTHHIDSGTELSGTAGERTQKIKGKTRRLESSEAGAAEKKDLIFG